MRAVVQSWLLADRRALCEIQNVGNASILLSPGHKASESNNGLTSSIDDASHSRLYMQHSINLQNVPKFWAATKELHH